MSREPTYSQRRMATGQGRIWDQGDSSVSESWARFNLKIASIPSILCEGSGWHGQSPLMIFSVK